MNHSCVIVFGFLKMKGLLLGVLLASPPVAAWMIDASPPRNEQGTQKQTSIHREATTVDQVPVEIVTDGTAPQWVYVEVDTASVPEPGVVSLMAVASLLLFRRQRSIAK